MAQVTLEEYMQKNKLLKTISHTCYVEIWIGRALKQLLREAGEFPPLEMFRSSLDKVLSSLVWLCSSHAVSRGLDSKPPEVSSSVNLSVSPWISLISREQEQHLLWPFERRSCQLEMSPKHVVVLYVSHMSCHSPAEVSDFAHQSIAHSPLATQKILEKEVLCWGGSKGSPSLRWEVPRSQAVHRVVKPKLVHRRTCAEERLILCFSNAHLPHLYSGRVR